MKTLPKYFAIKRQPENPLWEKYILFLNQRYWFNLVWNDEIFPLYGFDWYCKNEKSLNDFNAWTVLLTLEEWDSIVNPTTYYQVKIKEIKKPNLSYETQYLRSDWILFTKDTIDWKNIEDLKQEMNNHVAEANKIRGLLKAHKNKF